MNEAIDDELREYVQALRATDRPDPAAQAATWARIEARIAAEPTPSRRATPWLLLALAAGVALSIGLAAALPRRTAAPTRDLSNYQHIPGSSHPTPPTREPPSSPPPRPPAPPVTPPPQPDPTTTATAQLATPATPPPQPDATATPASQLATAAHPSPRRRPQPSSPSLRPEEVASFRTAQAALTDDDGATALQLLDAHGRRFPGGVFEQERQVARAVALCKLGRISDAHALRDEFLAAHPTSHLGDRMRHSCREIE